MPRVSGDTQVQAGSAWLAATPPTWLIPTQKDIFATLESDPTAVADTESWSFIRSTLTRSSSALRKFAKNPAA